MTEREASPGAFTKALRLLTGGERLRLAGVLCALLLVAIVEMAGIASIMPFVAVVTNPQVVEENQLAASIAAALGLETRQQILLALGVAVLGLVVLGNVAKACSLWLTLRYENSLNYRLASRLLSNYVHRPYVFYLNRNASELGKNVLAEVRTVLTGVIGPALNIAAGSFVVLAVISLLFVVNPSVALSIALVMGGVYGAVYSATRRRLAKIGAEQVRANTEKFRAANEAMCGVKDIKVLGREGYFLGRFERAAARHARNNVSAGVIAAVPRFALESIAFGGMVAILVSYIARGESTDTIIPLVALYAFAGYRVLPAFQQVYQSMSSLRYNSAALDTLYADLASFEPGSRVATPSASVAPLVPTRSLALEQATFWYPNASRPSLAGVSLEIPTNTTVAFVGPTGSGKTTAVDAILGLLKLGSGRLLVDGQPIEAETLPQWQAALGYVPQQIYLIDDTVRRNIAFGVPDSEIDEESLEQAARAANIHAFVTNELPQRYDTVVGDRGVRLSGGQRQRIGIARALYRNPSVLIFDEATSALDTLTEEAIMSAVRELAGRKTIILIAHRLSTVEHADRIFVIEKGELVAAGTYAELRESSSWFRLASGT